jgi:hypothetical protein
MQLVSGVKHTGPEAVDLYIERIAWLVTLNRSCTLQCKGRMKPSPASPYLHTLNDNFILCD